MMVNYVTLCSRKYAKLFAIITALVTGGTSVTSLFGSQSISAVITAGGIEGAN